METVTKGRSDIRTRTRLGLLLGVLGSKSKLLPGVGLLGGAIVPALDVDPVEVLELDAPSLEMTTCRTLGRCMGVGGTPASGGDAPDLLLHG